MNISTLINIARRDFLNDTGPNKYTWNNDFFLRSFSEAQRQACNRVDFLFSDAGYLKLRSGVAGYQIPNEYTKITALTYDGEEVEKVFPEQLPRGWRNDTGFLNHCPVYFVRGNIITFYPKPDASDASIKVKIEGYLTVLDDFTSTQDEPIIPPEHHKALIHWVCHEAYSNEVTNADYMDKKDFQKSQEHLAAFDAYFGRQVRADVKMHLFKSQG